MNYQRKQKNKMQYGIYDKMEVINMKQTKKYDYKKTLQKALRVGAYVVVLGLLSYVTEQPGLLVLAPLLEGARDYLKHKDL